jgi:ComF family protein
MRALLDIVMPPTCGGCGAEGAALCGSCLGALSRRAREPAGAPVGMPATLPDGIVSLEWCASFSGPVREALHALKYRGQRGLVGPLADALAERWRRSGCPADVVAWVPVHLDRLRERGFDQAELLARALAQRVGVPVAGLVERRTRTAAQHDLGRGDRAGNVGGAFAVPPGARGDVAGRWVALVDDVVTTGATRSGCARALRAAGATAVSAVTVARER